MGRDNCYIFNLQEESSQGQDVTKEMEAMSRNTDNGESQISKLSKAQKRRVSFSLKQFTDSSQILSLDIEIYIYYTSF